MHNIFLRRIFVNTAIATIMVEKSKFINSIKYVISAIKNPIRKEIGFGVLNSMEGKIINTETMDDAINSLMEVAKIKQKMEDVLLEE